MAGAPDSASEDPGIALGKLALERGLISQQQLREALAEQARGVAAGRKQPRPLKNILVEKKYLTNEQLLSLIEARELAASRALKEKQTPSHASLGKYEIVRELGRGGMGVVYEAVDTQLDRRVALKMMLTNPNADPKEAKMDEERFLREARLCASLPKHANIVAVHEVGIIGGKRYLAMEFVDGSPMIEWRKVGSVSIRQHVALIRDVLLALHHAHEQGLIHRDIKPHNVLVDAKNQPHVVDFGLAKTVGQSVSVSLTASGMVVGTPIYMSPEQAQGLKSIDGRTDIYAVGVMLYEALTGRPPFTGETAIEILMKAAKHPVPPPSSVVKAPNHPAQDKAIENICLKALAKNPRDRYPTAEAFAKDLTRWLSGEQVKVIPPTARRVYQPPKSKAWAYLLAAAALVIVAGVTIAFRPRGAAEDTQLKLQRQEQAREHVRTADELLARGRNVEALQEYAKAEGLDKENRSAVKGLEETRARLAQTPLPGIPTASSMLAPEVEWEQAIDLLKLLDPEQDAVAGQWKFAKDGLSSDQSPEARIEIPYQPPEEYDFRVTFTPLSGGNVTQIMSKGGRSFAWMMGGWANTVFGFDMIGGVRADSNPSCVRLSKCFDFGKSYTSTVHVRREGVKAFLEGRLIGEWKTGYRDMDKHKEWKLRNDMLLGLGTWGSPTVFHAARVIEVTGHGIMRRRPLKKDDVDAAISQVRLDLGNGVTLGMIPIKPGAFTMGTNRPKDPLGPLEERPARPVTITRGFFLGKFEVTRGQFAAFAGASGYRTDAEREGFSSGRRVDGWGQVPGLSWRNPGFWQTDDHPVVCVSWNDAKAFCDWAAAKTGRDVRLPTEAEWEYACRGGTTTLWSFGDQEQKFDEYGWTGEHYWQTHTVGMKKPNPWGLFDMHGNAWEWCQDWVGPYPVSATDPTGPSSGAQRCVRGGGYHATEGRSAFRAQKPPAQRDTYVGFRVAVTLSETGASAPSRPPPEVDLLKLIDPQIDSYGDKWSVVSGVLVSPAVSGPALLAIPYVPPEEYDLELSISRQDGSSGGWIGLVGGGRQFELHFDAIYGRTWGLGNIDGKPHAENETRRDLRVFEDASPRTVICSIRKTKVTVSVEGKVLVDWPADFSRVSTTEQWSLPNKKVLSLGSYKTSFAFSKIILRVVTGTGQPLR